MNEYIEILIKNQEKQSKFICDFSINQVEKNKLVTEILEYHSKKINKLEFIIFFLGIAIILLTVKIFF